VTKKIEELQVDGDLLLLLTEKNLQHDLGVSNAITRKRFVVANRRCLLCNF